MDWPFNDTKVTNSVLDPYLIQIHLKKVQIQFLILIKKILNQAF